MQPIDVKEKAYHLWKSYRKNATGNDYPTGIFISRDSVKTV